MGLSIPREEIECRRRYTKVASSAALGHRKADLLLHQDFFRDIVFDVTVASVSEPEIKWKQDSDKEAGAKPARKCNGKLPDEEEYEKEHSDTEHRAQATNCRRKVLLPFHSSHILSFFPQELTGASVQLLLIIHDSLKSVKSFFQSFVLSGISETKPAFFRAWHLATPVFR